MRSIQFVMTPTASSLCEVDPVRYDADCFHYEVGLGPKEALDRPHNQLDRPHNELDRPHNESSRPHNELDRPHNELAVGVITNWIDLIMN